uniref:Zinc-finger domain-containing protein n=1 Tax=Kalmanozyma brasiliensis (strain GHG001) TaxID=1365824 RepID=V5EVG4_KALBG
MPLRRYVPPNGSDSSDDEAPSTLTPHPPSAAAHDDLDDVVTPELPSADASAPALPDVVEDLLGAPELPPPQVNSDTEPDLNGIEVRHTSQQTEESASPPEPPPDPLADQRRLLDPEDPELLLLYDAYKANQASDEEDDDDDYEQRTLRRRLQNDALLVKLGLAKPGTVNGDASSFEASATPQSEDGSDRDDDDEPTQTRDVPSRGRGRPRKRARSNSAGPSQADRQSSPRKKKKYERKVKFAEDGTTKSAPLPGETFDFAYVEVPALRDRARNEYIFIKDVPDIRPEDLISWSEDEEDDEEDAHDAQVIDADTDDDDRFRGYDSLGRIKTKRRYRQPDVLPDGTVMTSCHQCRRKTQIPKMQCSRCDFKYCERCLTIRYDDVVFDPQASNFSCPNCLGYCNCSRCLIRSGFGDLVRNNKERLMAFTRERMMLADPAALEMEEPLPKKAARKTTKKARQMDADQALHAPKKRGRPLNDRESEIPWTPVKIDLDLSEEVEEGEPYSQLEEYVLGRLSVARRVLKLIAAQQSAGQGAAAASRASLVVRLKIPARALLSARTFNISGGAKTERKRPNHHDLEKDVWVRSAADYSTSESEFGSEDGARDEDLAGSDDEEGASVAEFEEGRTQAFSASLLRKRENTSGASSRNGSPLSSADELGSDSSTHSSQFYEEVKHAVRNAYDSADEIDELDTSTQASFGSASPSASLGAPQDMQQFALAVLEDHDEPTKTVHTNMLRFREHLVSLPPPGSEAAQLNGLIDPRPTTGTPVLYAETALSDADEP